MSDSNLLNVINPDIRTFDGFDVDSITTAPLQLIQIALLNTSKQDAFSIVSDHEGMANFSVCLTKVSVEAPDDDSDDLGLGTKRYCQTPVRFVIQEEIVHWNPPNTYGYAIKNCNSLIPGHLSLVQLESVDATRSLLVWRTYFRGRRIGGMFAEATLNVIMPDLVGNIAKQFNGSLITPDEVARLAQEN